MPLPKSVKFSKNGVEFLSNCDRIQYTLNELARAALRDSGKFISKQVKKLVPKRRGMLRSSVYYKVAPAKDNPYVKVGYRRKFRFKGDEGWGTHGVFFEVGATIHHRHKDGSYTYTIFKPTEPLENGITNNIAMMKKIQSQYLSAVGSESAEGMINEGEYEGE